MECWRILQAKPHKERQVAVQLHQRGLTVYLPMVWVNPINPRAARERPYFPGYLFARVPPLAGPSLLRWSPGLKQVVEFDGEPAIISDHFVAELGQRLEQIRAVSSETADGSRAPALVEIKTGPFSGFEGIFSARLTASARAQLLLTCVQRHHWEMKKLAGQYAEPDVTLPVRHEGLQQG